MTLFPDAVPSPHERARPPLLRYRSLEGEGEASKAELEDIHREMTEKSPNRFHLTAPIPMEATLVVV